MTAMYFCGFKSYLRDHGYASTVLSENEKNIRILLFPVAIQSKTR